MGTAKIVRRETLDVQIGRKWWLVALNDTKVAPPKTDLLLVAQRGSGDGEALVLLPTGQGFLFLFFRLKKLGYDTGDGKNS